jgi:hypothetical protein
MSKNLSVKSKMFPRRNIHIFTWASPVRKTHNQVIDRRRHSGVLDVHFFMRAGCDTSHSLMVAKNYGETGSKQTSNPTILYGEI